MSIPSKDEIKIGSNVSIQTKGNQGTDKLTVGIVKQILTSDMTHPHGIKVLLEDGQIGRVKNVYIKTTTPRPPLSNPLIPQNELTEHIDENSVTEFEDLGKKGNSSIS